MNTVHAKRLVINKPVAFVFSFIVGYLVWLQVGAYAPAYRTIEVPIFIDSIQDIIATPASAYVTFQAPRKALRYITEFKPSIQIPTEYTKLDRIELDPSMVVCHEAFTPIMVASNKIILTQSAEKQTQYEAIKP